MNLKKTISKFYFKGEKTYFHEEYVINPPIIPPTELKCDFCGKKYITDKLFEKFGFNKNVCPECLKKSEINIKLSNENVQPIWRKRK